MFCSSFSLRKLYMYVTRALYRSSSFPRFNADSMVFRWWYICLYSLYRISLSVHSRCDSYLCCYVFLLFRRYRSSLLLSGFLYQWGNLILDEVAVNRFSVQLMKHLFTRIRSFSCSIFCNIKHSFCSVINSTIASVFRLTMDMRLDPFSKQD